MSVYLKSLDSISDSDDLGRKDSKQPSEKDFAFAFRLESIGAIFCDEYYSSKIVSERLRSQIDFLNSLYSSQHKFAYELRFISEKAAALDKEKRLELALLTRVSGPEAQKEAETYSQFLSVLLASRLPDYDFRLVEDEQQFNQILSPFHFDHVAEIRKRHQLIPLSTLTRGPSAGLLPQTAGSAPGESVYYVFPFIPRENDFKELIRLLFNLNQNLVLSCLLVPTVVSEAEIEFLNEQIVRCEKARADYSRSNQAYHRRADALLMAYEEQLTRLQDAPFLLQIVLASDEPINPALAESIGVEITEYQSPNSGCFYCGGYDVVFAESLDDQSKALAALNGLEFSPWGQPAEFGRWRFLVEAREANCAFKLPVAINHELLGLKITYVKPLPLPKEVKALISPHIKKTKVGLHYWAGVESPVFISQADRMRHVYTVGQTGTGKTTLLKKMVLDDLEQGNGLILIDPHGDLFNEVLGLVPQERIVDTVVLDPVDMDYPVGLNLLEWHSREEKYFLVKELQEIIRRMMEDEYGPYGSEMTGPMFYHYMEMGLLLVMDNQKRQATIYDFCELFRSKDKWKDWVRDEYDDENVEAWVKHQLPYIDLTKQGDGGPSMGEYIYSKFKDFIIDPKLRKIFNQKKSTIDFKEIMDSGKVLLVNLAKGELSEKSSRFLGMVLMAKIMSAAMERIKEPKEKRRPFFVYVDEFQNIATSSFTVLLSEARKFGIGLTLANQFLSQIRNREIVQAIFGNVSSIISFRVGLADAEMLDDVFLPTIDRNNLVNLPNWQAAVRTAVEGRIVSPFYIKTEVTGSPDEIIRDQVRLFTRNHYSCKYSCK